MGGRRGAAHRPGGTALNPPTKTVQVLDSLSLRGFSSFGPSASPIELRALNVMIGPNGSGKSNLVEALALLRELPRDLSQLARRGGGVEDLIWYGEPKTDRAILTAVLGAGLVTHPSKATARVVFRLALGAEGGRFAVLDERIENELPDSGQAKPYFYFGYENGRPVVNSPGKAGPRRLRREEVDPTQSILSQLHDPELYPELTRVRDLLGQTVIYRDWLFERSSPVRGSCAADAETGRLLEDFSNLPARLAALEHAPATKRRIQELLTEIAPGFEDFEIVPEGGQLQLYVHESGHGVPARRLSDGTLRFLCLLAILVDPKPPPIVVIEGPELGLHPDVLPTITGLLVEASERCQLIVSTHSTQLVDSMTDHAECILVCEKRGGNSFMTRLSQPDIEVWRAHGSLGSLWVGGQIGGTRW